MKKPVSPCPRYCENRRVGCRSECSAWQEYELKKQAWYEYRAKVMKDDSDVLAVTTQSIKNQFGGYPHKHGGRWKRNNWKRI